MIPAQEDSLEKGETTHHSSILELPGGSDGKESACNVGDLGSIPGLGRSPGGGHDNPLHILAWRIPTDSGVSWASWGRKEYLDMTE